MNGYASEMVALGALSGAEYNPRLMDPAELEELIRSIETFGLVQPVVARKEDGLIIGGHQRATAMRVLLERRGKSGDEIAATEIPAVLIPNLDDARTKALNLALNKISGEWDYKKLAELFDSLPTVSDPELFKLTGFSEKEIADISSLMNAPEEIPRDAAQDEIDVDAKLAEQARRLVVQFDTAADSDLVVSTLRKFGMTGPGNAGTTLVKLVKALP